MIINYLIKICKIVCFNIINFINKLLLISIINKLAILQVQYIIKVIYI